MSAHAPAQKRRYEESAPQNAGPIKSGQAARAGLPLFMQANPTAGAGTTLQRKCACDNTPSANDECETCNSGKFLQAKLTIGASDDPLEQEADRVAEEVLATPSNLLISGVSPRIQRFTERATGETDSAPASVDRVLASPGKPMDPALRQDMEQRFGQDFSQVRVHSGAEAERSTQDVKANAYTVGTNIVFGPGRFALDSHTGRRLIAHELTHVVQQNLGHPSLQRSPQDDDKKTEPPPDPLCASITTLPSLPEGDLSQAEEQRKAIRTLKMVVRCGSVEQQNEYRRQLITKVGEETATILWAQAGTAFGGYVGMYPEFAPDMKRRLKKLGASESVDFSDFDAAARYQSRAAAAARREIVDLGRTDVLYFRGHQYAQYGAPGVFTSNGSRWVDLRYVQQTGGFANVKLLISTSCATICKEALAIFTGLFPNAVILGYRKSAPEDGGAVRDSFDKKIQGLKRGLLLDQQVDVDAIIGVWKATISAIHNGQTAPQPGYLRAGTVEYWDGKAWQTVASTSDDNKCKRKRDHVYNLPAPP